jgi:hypothetical protein
MPKTGSSSEAAIRARRAELSRGGGRKLPGPGDRVVDVTYRVERTSVPAVPAEIGAVTRTSMTVAEVEAEVSAVVRDLAAGTKLVDSGRVRLLRLKESGEWKRLGYRAWRTFCAERVGMTANAANRAIQAARMALEMDGDPEPERAESGAICTTSPSEPSDPEVRQIVSVSGPSRSSGGSMPDSQLRELAGLASREVGRVIARADEIAKDRGGKRSAKDLAAARRERYHDSDPAPESESTFASSATDEALESMKKPPCSECGRPFD